MISHAYFRKFVAIFVCLTAAGQVCGQTYFEPTLAQVNIGEREISAQAPTAPILASLGDRKTAFLETNVSQHIAHQPRYSPDTEIIESGQIPRPLQHDIAYSHEIQSIASENAAGGSFRERMRNHFWDASANAVTSGMTASIFGGPGLMHSYADSFGRAIGDEEFKGGVIGASVGKRFNSRWRTEIEVAWRHRESEPLYYWDRLPFAYHLSISSRKTELDTFSGMFNTYYDFNRGPGAIVTPYIGMGVGASYEEFSSGNYSSDESYFAIQGMAGLSIHLSRQSEFYFETRSFSQVYDDHYRSRYQTRTSHDLIFGLRRTF